MADQFRKSTSEIKASKITYKHLLERHRRARINNSLNELKHLVLSSLHHDDPQTYAEKVSERMEKADVLDLTVEFLKDNKQATNNEIQVERLPSEHAKDPARYHHIPAMPMFFPYSYPRMDSEYHFSPNATYPMNTALSIPPYLDSPPSSNPPSPVHVPANQIDRNQQPMNASENSASKSTEKEVWRPW